MSHAYKVLLNIERLEGLRGVSNNSNKLTCFIKNTFS